MRTTEIKNHVISTKIVRNEVYLTAIVNTQEQEIQRLRAINNELSNTNTYGKYYVSFHFLYFIIGYSFIYLFNDKQKQPRLIYEPQITETNDTEDVTQLKSFSIESISSEAVKFIDDSEFSDDYCE